MSTSLSELKWRTLVLGSSFPDDFDNGNWTSPPGCQNNNFCRRNKWNSTGELQKCKKGGFFSAGYDRFPSMRKKAAFTNSKGQYLWLQLHGATKNKRNPKNQIRIVKVQVFGYPVDQPSVDPNENQKEEAPIPEESSQRRKRDPITRFSYNGDGMTTGEGGLSTDPLTCVRTVTRAIDRKKSAAKTAGRTVEATLSLRAVQRLSEYEAILEELASKRRMALAEGDMTEVERVKLTMEDCRDTALRSSHVDILLGEAELRAIGVTSEWTEQP